MERTQDQGISDERPRQEKALVGRERELSRRAGLREHTPGMPHRDQAPDPLLTARGDSSLWVTTLILLGSKVC